MRVDYEDPVALMAKLAPVESEALPARPELQDLKDRLAIVVSKAREVRLGSEVQTENLDQAERADQPDQQDPVVQQAQQDLLVNRVPREREDHVVKAPKESEDRLDLPVRTGRPADLASQEEPDPQVQQDPEENLVKQDQQALRVNVARLAEPGNQVNNSKRNMQENIQNVDLLTEHLPYER